MVPTCSAFHGGLGEQLTWPKAGWTLVFELFVACSAVDVTSPAAFKYPGGLRQWLPHGFFSLLVIVWGFFFFDRLHQNLVQMSLC